MHIRTHHDRIWQAGCQLKENKISIELENYGIVHRIVDAVQQDLTNLPYPFASDNQFRLPVNYINLAPEFWHIYRCSEIRENIYPDKHFNVMMNRLSGERLMLLYKLKEANLFQKGYIGFNCLYHDKNPTVSQRQQHFANMHQMCGWHQWDSIYQELLPEMPMLLDMDPDTASMKSDITLVVESYVNDKVIAFSEKIFRALQTPRPWILFCSPGSVEVLQTYGFDVMADIVDHSYDKIVDAEDRLDKIIVELQKPRYFDLSRYTRAVEHNQNLLDKFAIVWPHKLSYLLQSIKD